MVVRRGSLAYHERPTTKHRSYTGLSTRMTTREFTTHSAEETIVLGRSLAAVLATLVKGIAEGFQAASAENVTSPTFTLVHEYRGPEVSVYHIDLYRVDTQRELETLGLDDLRDDKSVLLIEWGDKFPRFEQERDVEITLTRVAENDRQIRVIR